MKRQIMGRDVVVAITNGKLDFGPWGQLFYGEFGGRRPKKMLGKVIGEWSVKTNFDRRKSLQELENDDWGKSDFDSHLARTCHRLRHLPLKDFETGDLRIMIGQQISLFFLVPFALEKLEKDPLVEGNYYPGDLLKVVLEVPEKFWGVHTDMGNLLRQIVVKTKELLVSLEEDDARLIREMLVKPLDASQE